MLDAPQVGRAHFLDRRQPSVLFLRWRRGARSGNVLRLDQRIPILSRNAPPARSRSHTRYREQQQGDYDVTRLHCFPSAFCLLPSDLLTSDF